MNLSYKEEFKMKRFESTIENLINTEMKVRNEYIDRMVYRNFPEIEHWNIDDQRKFIIDNDIYLVNENEDIYSRVYLYEKDNLIDGFEMEVDYDEEEIRVNENII